MIAQNMGDALIQTAVKAAVVQVFVDGAYEIPPSAARLGTMCLVVLHSFVERGIDSQGAEQLASFCLSG
jgi:hypothetical protein